MYLDTILTKRIIFIKGQKIMSREKMWLPDSLSPARTLWVKFSTVSP